MTAGRDSKADLVYVDEKSVKQLQSIARLIREQSTQRPSPLTKELNKEIREAAEPMRRDVARAALGINFTSTSRAGASRARRTGRTLKSGRFKAGKGLRRSLSDGIRTQIDTGPYTAGVRVRMASSNPEINALGKRLNYAGRIRHPLFGDTDHWYDTKATNAENWFYRAAAPHRDMTAKRVQRVLNRWVDRLARDISKAA